MSRPPLLPSEEKKHDDCCTSVVISSPQHTFGDVLPAFSLPQHSLLASSHAETLLISSAGDVLTVRCRNSPYPSSEALIDHWKEDIALLCCEASYCTGLLGGAPDTDMVSSMFQNDHNRIHTRTNTDTDTQTHTNPGSARLSAQHFPSMASIQENSSSIIFQRIADHAFRSQHIPVDTEKDAESILPIRSFDHSLFYEQAEVNLTSVPLTNKQSRTEPTKRVHTEKENYIPFQHGVPFFSNPFANIKVKTVSANPAGSHVLLISNAGLLYSYGLNNFGQLGIGMTSDVRGVHKGYVMTPTIVTPLVENGGKAVACAAGVDHSLVVVETQFRRLLRSQSFDGIVHKTKSNNAEEIVHHQVYGFGCNSFMKIGLVRPQLGSKEKSYTTNSTASTRTSNDAIMEYVELPRRVALHASFPKSNCHGVVSLAAGTHHSAAILRTSDTVAEVYTWGRPGALGSPVDSSIETVSIPKLVPGLSVSSSAAAVTSTSQPSLLYTNEYPIQVSLGAYSSFVVTSHGRCFAFGKNDEGMLGLGEKVNEQCHPTALSLPGESIISVNVGVSHVLATTERGSVYTWGVGSHAGIVVGETNVAPSSENANHVESTSLPWHINWSPRRIQMPFEQSFMRSSQHPASVVQACAGFDCSIYVSESGGVYSSGKNSGRLGLGELSRKETVIGIPRPMFGGLHLWRHNDDKIELQLEGRANALPTRKKLQRGSTMS